MPLSGEENQHCSSDDGVGTGGVQAGEAEVGGGATVEREQEQQRGKSSGGDGGCRRDRVRTAENDSGGESGAEEVLCAEAAGGKVVSPRSRSRCGREEREGKERTVTDWSSLRFPFKQRSQPNNNNNNRSFTRLLCLRSQYPYQICLLRSPSHLHPSRRTRNPFSSRVQVHGQPRSSSQGRPSS